MSQLGPVGMECVPFAVQGDPFVRQAGVVLLREKYNTNWLHLQPLHEWPVLFSSIDNPSVFGYILQPVSQFYRAAGDFYRRTVSSEYSIYEPGCASVFPSVNSTRRV